jgi:hypothetical protein
VGSGTDAKAVGGCLDTIKATGGPPDGGVLKLRLPGDDLPDVVYLEQLTSAVYPDKPAEIEHYRHIMNRLVVEADPPTATPATLRRILGES